MWLMINIHADGDTAQAAAAKEKLEELMQTLGLQGTLRDFGQGSMYTGNFRTPGPTKPEEEPEKEQ